MQAEFGQPFYRERVQLTSGGVFDFDGHEPRYVGDNSTPCIRAFPRHIVMTFLVIRKDSTVRASVSPLDIEPIPFTDTDGNVKSKIEKAPQFLGCRA
jgi:hypothetical protein